MVIINKTIVHHTGLLLILNLLSKWSKSASVVSYLLQSARYFLPSSVLFNSSIIAFFKHHWNKSMGSSKASHIFNPVYSDTFFIEGINVCSPSSLEPVVGLQGILNLGLKEPPEQILDKLLLLLILLL